MVLQCNICRAAPPILYDDKDKSKIKFTTILRLNTPRIPRDITVEPYLKEHGFFVIQSISEIYYCKRSYIEHDIVSYSASGNLPSRWNGYKNPRKINTKQLIKLVKDGSYLKLNNNEKSVMRTLHQISKNGFSFHKFKYGYVKCIKNIFIKPAIKDVLT
jgi:hypothetical protein